jgi:hypothetical protein
MSNDMKPAQVLHVSNESWDNISKNLNKKTIFGDILSFTRMNDRFPTDAEIAQMPKQGDPASYEAETIQKKEQIMSDEFDSGVQPQERSPEEKAFLAAVHQRKVIADALKGGKLSCLPGADGYADTAPAVNIANGTRYHGANLLHLKEFQKEHGFPTAEYVTQDAVQQSGIPLRKGEHGIDISFSVRNEESGEWEHRAAKLFNIAQSAKPWELKKWAANQVEERIQEKQEFLKSQFGESYQAPGQVRREPGPEITCTSTEPEKYLGQFLAAVSMGSKFKVDSKQAAAFSENFERALFTKMENGHTNPFSLSKICNAASDYCKGFIKEVRQEQRTEREQRQEMSRGGRGL